jgi:LPXTG-motif cell wall-anchored protein
MNASRIRVGIAVGVLGLALGTGSASAVSGTSSSGGDVKPNNESVPAKTETSVLPALEVAPAAAAPARVEAETLAAETAPAGALPVTGGDVAGLLLIGGAAVGAGTLLVRRSRSRTA